MFLQEHGRQILMQLFLSRELSPKHATAPSTHRPQSQQENHVKFEYKLISTGVGGNSF